MKNLLCVLPIIATVLSGCDAVSERDCDVFDHPELALWQPGNGPATVTYMSSDGTTKIFNRQSVQLNTAFRGTDGASNDEDVICELTATVRLQATDNSLAIESIYTQEEQLLLDSADEVLLIDHRLEAPVGTELPGDFPADISDSRFRLNFDSSRVTYLVADPDAEVDPDQDPTPLTEEINGQTYEDVIRINARDVTSDTSGSAIDAADFIRQIVLARNVGIVAFTDADDREFFHISSE